MLLVCLYACGGGSSGSSSTPPSDTNASALAGGTLGSSPIAATPASITLSADPSSLSASGSSTVTATVKDSGGNDVIDGTTVYFSVDNTSLGSITSSATTTSGLAAAIFTASTTVGTVTVTAWTSNNVTATLNIAISAASEGSIYYYSSSAKVLGTEGSGTDTATLTFNVYDSSGNSASDGTLVNFTLSGPGGGEYIGDSDGTPTEASSSTVGGTVSVVLHSGRSTGSCTVTATIDGTSASATSEIITIE